MHWTLETQNTHSKISCFQFFSVQLRAFIWWLISAALAERNLHQACIFHSSKTCFCCNNMVDHFPSNLSSPESTELHFDIKTIILHLFIKRCCLYSWKEKQLCISHTCTTNANILSSPARSRGRLHIEWKDSGAVDFVDWCHFISFELVEILRIADQKKQLHIVPLIHQLYFISLPSQEVYFM